METRNFLNTKIICDATYDTVLLLSNTLLNVVMLLS